MRPDVDAMAAEVVGLLTRALAPVQASVSTLQVQVAGWEARWSDLGTLRERVAVVEAQAALPAPVALETRPGVPDEALVDLRARVGLLETKAQSETADSALRERVTVMETKAALAVVPETRQPAQDEALVDLRARIGLLETKAQTDTAEPEMVALRERVAVVEAKAAVPPVAVVDEALVDLRARLGLLETKAQGETAQAEIAGLRERLAVLETRAPVPGPAGQNGVDGKNGVDGLGFGDLSVVQEHERTVIVRATRGDEVKDLGTLTFPVEIYRGVYQDGQTYERGDCATFGGSEWHANATTTTKPGDGSNAWTLKVKRGQNGRDGKDGGAR